MTKKAQKKVQPALDQRRLKELLHYDPETGLFRWKVCRKRPKANPGDVAGKRHPSQAYIRIGFDGWMWLAHRLAFLYMAGEWPGEQVDHIDGDPLNNKWSNLRAATPAENLSNARRRRANKSGYKGVSRIRNKWRAAITKNGKCHYLGVFETPEQAHAAYCAAAVKLAGQFARAA